MKRNSRNPFDLTPREARLLAKVARQCDGTPEAVALHLRKEQLSHEADGLAATSSDPLKAALGRIAKSLKIND